MPVIIKKTYRYEAKDFNTPQQVIDYIDNRIGSIIDSSNAILPAKERLKVFKMIENNYNSLGAYFGDKHALIRELEYEGMEWKNYYY